jgi:hypothetical protein
MPSNNDLNLNLIFKPIRNDIPGLSRDFFFVISSAPDVEADVAAGRYG